MKYKFFDSLTHIKVDETWYRTEKKASVQPLINSYENGELSGAVSQVCLMIVLIR